MPGPAHGEASALDLSYARPRGRPAPWVFWAVFAACLALLSALVYRSALRTSTSLVTAVHVVGTQGRVVQGTAADAELLALYVDPSSPASRELERVHGWNVARAARSGTFRVVRVLSVDPTRADPETRSGLTELLCLQATYPELFLPVLGQVMALPDSVTFSRDRVRLFVPPQYHVRLARCALADGDRLVARDQKDASLAGVVAPPAVSLGGVPYVRPLESLLPQ